MRVAGHGMGADSMTMDYNGNCHRCLSNCLMVIANLLMVLRTNLNHFECSESDSNHLNQKLVGNNFQASVN